MSEEREYMVVRPIRGTQTLFVKARSKADALRKVNSWDSSVEGVQLDVDYYGKARQAILGEKA